jgi:hypothetical protein
VGLANPGPAGLVAFSLTTIMLSLVNAGILPEGGEPVIIPLAIAFGGVNQVIAGILEFRVGNGLGMTAFMSYGAFWLWFALLFLLGHNGKLDLSEAGPTVPVALLVWGALTIGFWISAFRTSFTLWMTFTVLIVVFFLLGLSPLLGVPGLRVAGGYLGIVTGLLAGYCGIAQLTNATFGRVLLPLGEPLVRS